MEYMNRSLSAKIRTVPQSRGSFRKPKDYGDWNDQVEEDEWIERSIPERRRIVDYIDPGCESEQKVTIDLGLTPSYKKEGDNYVIRAELFDILWSSNMLENHTACRGWFIDNLEIHFQPSWKGQIVAGNLFPAASNFTAYFGTANQASISGFISRNPMVGATLSKTRSQQTSQPMYLTRWERGEDGSASFNWKLNLWCPSSNSEYPKLYDPANGWNGSRVPMLPPDYEKGDFNGLNIKPKVEWVVPASVVRSGRVSWNVTVRATLSMLTSKKGILSSKREWARHSFSQTEEWKFSKKTSGHIVDWQPASASSCCRAAYSQCHRHHSCRPVQ